MPKPTPANQAIPVEATGHQLDRARERNVTFECKTFVRAGLDWDYYLFRGSGIPPNVIGAPGDIYESTESEVWVRYEDTWKRHVPGERDGRPIQKHPTLKAERCLRRSDLTWVCYSGYKPTSNKRARYDTQDGPLTADRMNRVSTMWTLEGQRVAYPGWRSSTMTARTGHSEVHYASASMPAGPYNYGWYPAPNKGTKAMGTEQACSTVTPVAAAGIVQPALALVHPAVGLKATDDLPRVANPANSWMIAVYEQILGPAVSIVPPLQERCKALWKQLMKRPEVLHEYSEDGITYRGPPKTAHKLSVDLVILDMTRTTDILSGVDYITNNTHDEISAFDVLASFVGTGRSAWSPVRRYWGVLQIPATNNGVKSAQIDTVDFTKDGVAHIDGDWDTALVPAGAITQPHIDYSGCVQYSVHIAGDKIWLTWPPTERNLEWLNIHRPATGAPPHDLVTRAVEELEGLRLHRFRDDSQQTFTLDPCRIHAVLTLSNAAHTGVRCVMKEHFEEAMRLARFHIRLATHRSDYGLTIAPAVVMLNTVLMDLDIWEKAAFIEDHQRNTIQEVTKSVYTTAEHLRKQAVETDKPPKKRRRSQGKR